MKSIQEKHDKMLYCTVRVRTEKAGGSGTVVYSGKIPDSEGYETYILTNHHVIAGNIKIEEKWSTLLQRLTKTDIFSECSVEDFNFEYGSWESGHSAYKADIMCYDKNMDIALLKLKSEKQMPYVVNLFPKNEHKKKLRMFQELYAIGCGLGHPPIATQGLLTGFTDVIDNYPFWMSTAPTIYGNSGGAVFLKDTYEFIGIPSRIAVTMAWMSADAITHMSYFIPITSIYDFFDAQVFQFIYDKDKTSKECETERKEKRKDAERMLKMEIMKKEGE